MKELDRLLSRTGLRAADDTPNTIFSKIMNTINRVFGPLSAAEVEMTLSEIGIPIIKPRVEFGETKQGDDTDTVRHEEALGLLGRALEDADLTTWVVFDRLDEAFQGHPETEIPALRSLFRTYLDLLEFPRIKLKLFVRRDLFRKLTRGGFVNLTHVNARKIEIVWDEEDLKNLLCRRLRENSLVIDALEAEDFSDDQLFNAVFPDKVDDAERKPTTWRWLMGRIRDGNGVKPPRNLIDLIVMAREAQIRREEREGRIFETGQEIIESDSIKKALTRLSGQRVEDTLLAEADELGALIDKFRGGKAEHNESSLAEQIGVQVSEVKSTVKPLEEIGFLEQVGDSFKIPMLYRDGLEITQGKAF